MRRLKTFFTCSAISSGRDSDRVSREKRLKSDPCVDHLMHAITSRYVPHRPTGLGWHATKIRGDPAALAPVV